MRSCPVFCSFTGVILTDVPSGIGALFPLVLSTSSPFMSFYKNTRAWGGVSKTGTARTEQLCRLERGGRTPVCHPLAPREATACNAELPAHSQATRCLTAMLAGAEGGWSRWEAAVRFAQPRRRVSRAGAASNKAEWMGLIYNQSQMLLSQLDTLLCLLRDGKNACDGHSMGMHHHAAVPPAMITQSPLWTVPNT